MVFSRTASVNELNPEPWRGGSFKFKVMFAPKFSSGDDEPVGDAIGQGLGMRAGNLRLEATDALAVEEDIHRHRIGIGNEMPER